jgi:flagellar basal-body rod protein FlgG
MSDIQVPGIQFDQSGKNVSPDGAVTFQPQAFFTVQDANGEQRYTRDGKFTLDEQGYLTMADGSRVLGTNGAPIQLPPGMSMDQLTVTPEHRLVNPATNTAVGQFLITRVDNPNELVREGDGKFRYIGDGSDVRPLNPGDRVEVRQGYIERSNVDSAQSMVDLMSAMRAYEANQKVIQFYDRSLDKAVNDVGRV